MERVDRFAALMRERLKEPDTGSPRYLFQRALIELEELRRMVEAERTDPDRLAAAAADVACECLRLAEAAGALPDRAV